MGNLWATWGYTWTHACRGPLAANVLAEIHDLRTTWKVHHDACYPDGAAGLTASAVSVQV